MRPYAVLTARERNTIPDGPHTALVLGQLPRLAFHIPLFETTNSRTDCGEVIAKVLEALPETPLFAIANNTSFEGGLGELNRLAESIRGFPMLECPPKSGTVEQRTFHVGVTRDEHETINLQLSLLQDKIELSCNAHRKLDSRDDASSVAMKAVSSFFKDREEATRLAKHFFGSESAHDTDNDG